MNITNGIGCRLTMVAGATTKAARAIPVPPRRPVENVMTREIYDFEALAAQS